MLLKSFVFLFFIYNVKFTFLGGIGSFYFVLLYFISITLLQGKFVNINALSLLYSSVFFFLFLVTFIVYYPDADLGLLKFSFVALISVIISGAVYKQHFAKNPILFFGVIGYAGIINAIMIVLMLIFPEFQKFYLQYIIVEAKQIFGDDIIDGFFSLRMIGVTGFATYSTAFTQCLCVFSYYIYSTNYYRKSGAGLKISHYLVILLMLSSAVIAARSAFIGAFILFVMMLCDKNNRGQNVVFLVFCLVFFVGILSFLMNYFPSEKSAFFINWITELFNKGTKVGSVQKMGDMFHFEYLDFHFFGDAKLNNSSGGYYMGVDIGYLRLLFAAGYLGFLLIFFTFVASVKISKMNTLYLVYTLFLFLLISVFMVKGLIIFDAFYILFYILLASESFRQLSLYEGYSHTYDGLPLHKS